MESGIIKWHVHCTVCGAFLEKSSNSNSEIMCNKCHTTLEIFVKNDMVSVRPIHIRDEQLKSRMRTYSRKMMNQKYFLVLEIVEVFVLSGFFMFLNFLCFRHCILASHLLYM